MADINQRKIADPIEIDDDDPFAELTRIMGFDPRKPVTAPQNPAPEPVNARAPEVARTAPYLAAATVQPPVSRAAVDEDDFGIDLEKELLGGFDDFDQPAAPVAPPVSAHAETRAASAAYHPAEPAASVPAADDVEFENALNDAIDWEPMEAELASAQSDPVGQASGQAEPAVAPQAAAPTLDDQLDADLAAELDLGLSALSEDHGAATEPVSGTAASWSETATEAAAAAETWSAPSQYDADDLAARDDRRVAAEGEHIGEEPLPEFDLSDLDLLDDERGDQPVAKSAQAEQEPAAELAELDLQGDAHDEWQIPADEPARTMPAPALRAEEKLPAHPEKEAPGADVFADVDMDFSAAFEEEFDDAVSGVAQRAAPVAAAAPQAIVAAVEAKPQQSVAPASADAGMALEDELSALLEQEHHQLQVQQPQAVEATATAPAVEDRPRGNFLSDPRWAAPEAAEEDVSVSTSRVLRPAASFGAALTGRHANFQMPSSRPQQIDDLDDLLDAMEHEGQSPQNLPNPTASAAASPQPQQPSQRVAAAEPERQDFGGDASAAQTARYEDDGVPEIETVDVPEPAIALADDLDLPSLDYEEDEPQKAAAYDDLEAEFAASFRQSVANDAPVEAARSNAGDRGYSELDFASLYRSAPRQAEAGAASDEIDFGPLAGEDDRKGDDNPEQLGAAARQHERYVDLDFGDGAESQGLPAVAAYQDVERRRRFRAPYVAALVGGVALLGGAGTLALSYFGGGQGEAPVLVQADDSPVKVKPDNPGGAAVPNQGNRVYDAVKGTAAPDPAAPSQPKLVTTQEEPIDVAAVDKAEAAPAPVAPSVDEQVEAPDTDAHVGSVSALPGVEAAAALPAVAVPKAEDRVDPVADADPEAAAEDPIALAPRRVKTMMVRADGTLVPRDEPLAAGETQEAAASGVGLPAAPDESGSIQASDDQPVEQAAADEIPVKSVKSTKLDGTGQPAGETVPPKPVRSTKVDAAGKPQMVAEASEAAPKAAVQDWQAPAAGQEAVAEPVPQPKPAKAAAQPAPQPKPAKAAAAAAPAQPKPEETKPVEVASADVEPTTAVAAGTWSVQIASQPSADSAKSTYDDLARRYASVLGGRGVNIVKADIEGKGTYWRVRVPAKSRDDAVSLCTDYKAAGGNCFVSK